MKKRIVFVMFLFANIISILAQDAEGCKDHPLLTRLKDFEIDECSQNYNQIDFLNMAGEYVKVDGFVTSIRYINRSEDATTIQSPYQIIKNYANAILKIGGKKVYEDANFGCYELKKNNNEYKIMVSEFNNGNSFLLNVVEIKSMVQDVTANEMLVALNKDGYIALNILFETGKSTIQKESLPIIDQIYELMNNNADLKLSIEGHTDNVGDAVRNKQLSNDRAKAVNDALVAKGINKTRLSFVGWGQEKPVGDNRTDDGKAKNRRVEIVKK